MMQFKITNSHLKVVDGKLRVTEIAPVNPTTTTVAPIACDDPTMLLTVTGDSGTINWCGETWNLPADSGEQREVCPTSYNKGKGYTQTTTHPTLYLVDRFQAGHWWSFNSDLNLYRNYNIVRPTTGTNWYQPLPTYNMNRLQVKTAGFTDYSAFVHLFAPTPSRPISFSATSTNGSDLGFIGGVPGALYSDYELTNEFFGSTVNGGITYEWEKGAGW